VTRSTSPAISSEAVRGSGEESLILIAVYAVGAGIRIGSAFFIIPGIGPILAAGHVVAWIVGALEGAVVVGGVSALGAGLYSMGIPKDSIVKYESALKTDQFLLIVHGTAAEVAKARDIIETTHPAELDLHSGELVAVD
jgi:hypothetical protein